MNRTRTTACLALFGLLALAAQASGQQLNSPHLGYVYPAGGQRGTTFTVSVGGRFLDGVSKAVVSGPDVSVRVVGHDKPLTPQQITQLRDRLQELQKQGNTPAVQKELAEARMKIGDSVRRNANPVLSETVTLEVSVAPGAERSSRQLRLLTPLGLSNPLVFRIGDLPEFREKDRKSGPADAESQVTLPATINGRLIPGDVERTRFPLRQLQQYAPGDVDRYRFQARKGQHLVAAVSARSLMPYLADAVPGWFQATIALFDAEGHELRFDDDYRFHPDPVLHYEVPRDGDYVLEIKDALYRGREDFVYRIDVGELPFVTAVFPPGGLAGSSTKVQLDGWNLPAASETIDARREKSARVIELPARERQPVSNRVPFALGTLAERTEREPNNAVKDAQQVTLPVVLNGRVQEPGDVDVFAFKAKAGDQVVAEVTARRIESPLDSFLELTDAAGRRLAFNDDHDDKAAGLITHHADSLLAARLPAAGSYFLRIGDRQRKGGPEYAYRVRISPPRPDFELRIAPSEINGPASASVPIAVTAIRRDGFAGDIALSLKDSPGGFVLHGGTIPAGSDQIRLTLTLPREPTEEPVQLIVEGRAAIEGQTVVRRAVPAEDMMQAFAYKHLVPSDALWASVVRRGATRFASTVLGTQPVRIPAGGTASVRVQMPPAYRAFEKIEFELSDPPEGVTLRALAIEPGGVQMGARFELRADGAKVKVGSRGNLIIHVSGERIPGPNQQATAVRRRVQIATLPAISYQIVPAS